MPFRLLGTFIVLFCISAVAIGFDAGAIIRTIDVDQRTAKVFAGGQERTITIADDAKILAQDGKDLVDGLGSKELAAGATVTLTVERVDNTPTIVAIRIGGKLDSPQRSNGSAPVSVGKRSVGFTPLDEMTADDRYKGEDGGLYGGGRNELPESLRAMAMEQTAKINPLDGEGQPAPNGKIALVSISMSNATQEFSRFKQLADADTQKSPRVTIVDCAQGGQTMARWADPKEHCWIEADQRLRRAGVSPEQVQVAWIKLANAGPSGDLDEHGKQLERDTQVVLANLMKRFPNLRIAYLGSRIYGGWADGRLNPEPYAYEGAFVVRWLITSQLEAGRALTGDADHGEVNSPLLLWGPYFWADGTTPRKSDGLVWQRSDLVGDGTHPSDTGRQKVAEQLLEFFKTDEFAKSWFVTP